MSLDVGPGSAELAVVLVGSAFLLQIPPAVGQHALLARMRAMALRTSLGTLLLYAAPITFVTAIVGLIAAFSVVPIAGFVVIALVSSWFVTRKLIVLDLLAVQRLEKLVEKNDREKAIALAERIVASTERLPPNVWTRFSLLCAQTVSAFDIADAERIASKVDNATVVGASSWALAHTLAIYRVSLGRYEDARHILDARAGEAPSPELLEQRELLHARLDASTGQAERALESAAQRESSDWDSVRAHAYAALGRADEAREALGRIREAKGVEALEQIAERKGPAAAIAAAMTTAAAYR